MGASRFWEYAVSMTLDLAAAFTLGGCLGAFAGWQYARRIVRGVMAQLAADVKAGRWPPRSSTGTRS